jgi:hypothetical protein
MPDERGVTPGDGERYRCYQQPFPSGDYSFFQLAFAVDDVVEAARRWVELQGVGPFFVLPDRGPATVRYRGSETELHTRLAVSQAGPLQIELVEQVSDCPSVFRDLYGPGEVGAHHLCTMTRDYDGSVGHYRERGCELIAEQDAPGIGRVGYIDTTSALGLVTEIVEWSDGFLRMLSGTARACARWDGSDPVRVLRLEGGYDAV